MSQLIYKIFDILKWKIKLADFFTLTFLVIQENIVIMTSLIFWLQNNLLNFLTLETNFNSFFGGSLTKNSMTKIFLAIQKIFVGGQKIFYGGSKNIFLNIFSTCVSLIIFLTFETQYEAALQLYNFSFLCLS